MLRLLFHPAAMRIAWTLVHFLWQGALLGLLAWGVLALLKTKGPQIRYRVACLFLLSCLAAPVGTYQRMTLPVERNQNVAISSSSIRPKPAVSKSEPVALSYRILISARSRIRPALPWILGLWIAGVVLLSVRATGGWLWLHRRRKTGRPVLDNHWRNRVEELRRKAGIRRAVRFLECARVSGPLATGILKPIILLPLGFFTHLDPTAAEAVLAHELAHIRRLDVLVNGLQCLIETLLFFHPAVWWISRRVRTEREHCCDDDAVQSCGNALLLAETLAQLSALPDADLSLAPGARGGNILERIQRLLGLNVQPVRITVPSLSVLVAIALGTVALMAQQEPLRYSLIQLPKRVLMASRAALQHEVAGTTQGLAQFAPQSQEITKVAAQTPGIEAPTSPEHPSMQAPANLAPVPINATVLVTAPPLPNRDLYLADLADLKSPSVDGLAHGVQKWTFAQGHGTYTLTGKVARVRAGNAICGLYFEGKGQLHYVSQNRLEFPILAFNLKQNALMNPEKSKDSMAVDQTFSSALFWFGGQALPEIPGPESPWPDPEFKAQFRYFRDVDTRGFLFDLALRSLKSTDKPYFRAQIKNRFQPWVHMVDDLDSENLSALRARLHEDPYHHPWATLSRQPIGWTYRVPKNPRFVLTHVDLDLDASKGTTGRLKVTETFLPLQEGIKALDLHLYGFRIGVNALDGYRQQDVVLKSVRDAAGNPVAFDHDDHRVLISLPDMQPDTPVTLTFEIQGEILPEKLGQGFFWRLDPGPWFPLPQDLAARAFTVHAKVKVPQPYVPFMGGDTLLRTEENGPNVLETRLDQPVQSFSILAWKIRRIREETRDGITVRFAEEFGGSPESAAQNKLNLTFEFLRFYREILGPLPFKELNFVGTANAPGMCSGWKDIPRQYWGQSVQPWSPEDQWILDAFADYCQSLLVLNRKEFGRSYYDASVKDWFAEARRVKTPAPLPLTQALRPFDGDWVGSIDRSRLMSKAKGLIYLIHQDLGDADFVKFMRTFQRALAGKRCTAGAVTVSLKSCTGKDFSQLFEDYAWGTAVPAKKP